MPAQSTFFKPLTHLDPDLDRDVGPLAHNLRELHTAGLPILPGFAVTTALYQEIYSKHLFSLLQSLIPTLDLLKPHTFHQANLKIRRRLLAKPQAHRLFSALSKHYTEHIGSAYSLIILDPELSSPRHLTHLPTTPITTRGDANFIQAVIDALLSPFSPESLYYLTKHHLDLTTLKPSLVVLKLPKVVASGVIFTHAPDHNSKTLHLIESLWGLPDPLFLGQENPTRFTFDFKNQEIIQQDAPLQTRQHIPLNNQSHQSKLKKDLAVKPPLNREELTQLSRLASKVHQHFFFPQQLFWLRTARDIFCLFSKPNHLEHSSVSPTKLDHLQLLAAGVSLSPGLASGHAKIYSPNPSFSVASGDILLCHHLSPEILPHLAQAAGVISQEGGLVSHAAVLARELSIPVISHLNHLFDLIQPGQPITLNASSGEIYAGMLTHKFQSRPSASPPPAATATKVMLYLDESSPLDRALQLSADGIGILNPFFIFQKAGIHPKHLISINSTVTLRQPLISTLHQLTLDFGDRPVIYQLSHFTSHQYRNLDHPPSDLPDPNPVIGFRGAVRHLSDLPTLHLELESLKLVRSNSYSRNLHLSLPFCRSPQEFLQLKREMAKLGLKRSPGFELWLDVQIPANFADLEAFISLGLDGLAIGIDTLAMLTLAIDPAHESLQPKLDFNHPAITTMLTQAAHLAQTHQIKTQLYSSYPLPESFLEFLLGAGFHSVTVKPEFLLLTRQLQSQAEAHIIT